MLLHGSRPGLHWGNEGLVQRVEIFGCSIAVSQIRMRLPWSLLVYERPRRNISFKGILNYIVISNNSTERLQHLKDPLFVSNCLHPVAAEKAEFQLVFQNEFFPHNKGCLPLSTTITCCGVNLTLCPEGLMAHGPVCASHRLMVELYATNTGRICNRDEWLHSSWSVMER